MATDDDECFLEDIRNGLRPLIDNDVALDNASRAIKKKWGFVSGKPPPAESAFFDFAAKLRYVTQYFEDDGLTEARYLRAALARPELFTLKPTTAIRHIQDVVDHFAVSGLTRRDYLEAALKQPALFAMKPETIAQNIERVVDHFSVDGLSRRDYLRVAVRSPSLFATTPATIIKNVQDVVATFANDGLTRSGYLRAVVSQPSILAMKPATVIGHIQNVVDHFAASGLTRYDYLQVALKQPALFAMNPETIIGHVNLVAELQRKGVLQLPRPEHKTSTDATTALAFMMNTPALLCLASDNLVARGIYALTSASTSPLILRRSRKDLERDLSKSLGHDNLDHPVSKIDRENGRGPHARNLLLRALIHEGVVKGRLE